MPIAKSIIDQVLATKPGRVAYEISEKLIDAGFDTWWVGGSVRDMLLKRIPSEIDVATEAPPDAVCALFPKHDTKGREFGSIVVRAGGESVEITTFREDDSASDGRHPESVRFGTRVQDASRRDFTINTMYWNPISRAIFDPFDGEKDLHERLIRFIGDPGMRISHDALRMLRAVRIRAKINGQYHPDTFHALQEHANEAAILSGTRVLEELDKILLGPAPNRALEDLWETGILKVLARELYECKGIPQPSDYHREGDVWEHTMKILSAFREDHTLDLRIAALFHDCGKAKTFSLKERIRFDEHAPISAEIASRVLARLQCPGHRSNKIHWLISHHMMMGFFKDMNQERKAHWYFHPWFHELLELFWLDIAGTDPQDYSLYGEILQDYHRFLDTHPRPPRQLLKGEEIMEILGLEPGERIGKIIQTLHEAQIRGEVTRKDEAREFIRKML